MTHLYLIRHGDSITAHEPHIRDVYTEDALTPLGIEQAERLRDRLAATREIEAGVLLASTLPRAYLTAEIIAPALGLPVVRDRDLEEWRPGDNGGMYWDDYVAQHGRPDPVREPFRPLAPGGENWGQLMLRVAATLHRLVHEHEGKTIVAVCHGGIVDGSLIGLLGTQTLFTPSFSLYTENTAITHWEHFEQDGRPRWRLHCYNDAAHLRGRITSLAQQG